ncbi:phosphonate ABC transporter substrate-binding protein [Paucibacter sp. APW11]|uniref:Phosphonate ABC transporter substrate-binding protein n=1 Tax=Roseateles aquae TaxID=3077235 RepID=A0ABU3PIB0_9BURK|nr:phosphonate ABC transporter substrate-binding protein [Paucibacter sp. APW11]MDT9002304.1 phosphonate ABC transporter substrate-binding protein [Paucibacter sp. APW11]
MQRRNVLALLATTAACWLGNVQAQAVKEINFGMITTESSAHLKGAWQPLLDDMSRATGLKVNAFFATDYSGVIEAMRFNKVQIGWFGNKSAIEAVDRAQGEVFAKTVGKDGNEGYYSILVVHADSPYKSLDDVLKARANLTLGFGDPNSTSGTLVPGYFAFAQNKVEPTRDFKRMVRANHETNLLAVVNKQVDVATNNTENWHRFSITNGDKLGQLREIWRSPLIASDPIVWRKDLDEGTKAKLRDFLLSYGKKPAEREILEKLSYSAFRASSNAQLGPVRLLELARERAKIENDAALAADEKSKKLADIDTRLAELNKQQAKLQ